MRRASFATIARLAFVPALLAAAPGCSGCGKKAPVEEVKKDVASTAKSLLSAVPPPADLVAEIYIKDPDGVAKKGAEGAGYGEVIGSSPFQKIVDSVSDEKIKRALKGIDPHAALAAVGIYVIGDTTKPHGAVAAHLKDAAIVSSALEAAAKGGDLKTWDSKSLGKVYESGTPGDEKQPELVIIDDMIVASDSRDSIEDAGKYVAWLSSHGPTGNGVEIGKSHDIYARIPMTTTGPALKAFAMSKYAKVTASEVGPKTKAELDIVVPAVLSAVADMGEIVANSDFDKDAISIDYKATGKGMFTAWLAAIPTGDAHDLLAMPKGESGSVFHYPDGLGPLVYAAIDEHAVSASTLSAADKADLSKALRTFGGALGHEVAYSSHASGKLASVSSDMEFVFRCELSDAAAAKASLPMVLKLAEKAAIGAGPSPVKHTPYKLAGAEGETLTIAGTATGGPDLMVLWAIRDNVLFLDLSLSATPRLAPIVIDPASTARLDSDPAAKAKIGSFPSQHLVSAAYGDSEAITKALGALGSGAAPHGDTVWSWSTADASGMVVRGLIPMSFVSGLLNGLTMARSLGAGGMMGADPTP